MPSVILSSEDKSNIKQANCFDFLRYLFATMLIVAHFCVLAQIDQFWFILGGMRVKAFFVITGFLVTYSFISRGCNIKIYAIKRIVRIIPAYIVVIFFAMIVGAFFSRIPIRDYFINPQTWRYCWANLCMLNWLQPTLPGLFETNSMVAVNGSLWTMKFGVLFYCLVPVCISCLKFINKHLFAVIVSLGIIAVHLLPNAPVQLTYFTYFFAGVVGLIEFSYFRRYIWGILLGSIAFVLLAHYVDWPGLSLVHQVLEPFLFASILLGTAYTVSFLRFFRSLPNVTYGLYLYHFPIIQLLISAGLLQYNTGLCFIITLLLTFAMANLSWFFIEKPLMDKYK